MLEGWTQSYETKLYLAGTTNEWIELLYKECGATRFLIAYPALQNIKIIDEIVRLKADIPALDLFLDSGAYSVLTTGIKVDIRAYISFLTRFKSLFDSYAGLDEIGDAEGTWRNQLEMEEAGLEPLCTFHYNEDFANLVRMVDKYEHFAIGGIAARQFQSNELIPWLEDVFRYAPNRKMHGFGLFALDRLQFPWYSVDSTMWMNSVRYGQVVMEDGTSGHATEYGLDHTKTVELTITTVRNILKIEEQVRKKATVMSTHAIPGFERQVE